MDAAARRGPRGALRARTRAERPLGWGEERKVHRRSTGHLRGGAARSMIVCKLDSLIGRGIFSRAERVKGPTPATDNVQQPVLIGIITMATYFAPGHPQPVEG